MTSTDTIITINVFGPFRVTGPNKTDMSPRGRKACAILAILVLSPDNRRTRRWIQDHLWSDRELQQRSASLRRCLSEIRKALGEYRNLLQADSQTLLLDKTKFRTDLNDTENSARFFNMISEVLLEGLVIRDALFTAWLEEQRQVVVQQLNSAETVEFKEVIQSPVLKSKRDIVGRNQLLLARTENFSSRPDDGMAGVVADTVAKIVFELGQVDVIDRRCDVASVHEDHAIHKKTFVLNPVFATAGKTSYLRFVLSNALDGSFIWSETMTNANLGRMDSEDQKIQLCINQLAQVAIREFEKINRFGENYVLASSLCQSGIEYLFRLGVKNFDIADQLFAKAYEIEPLGIALAWRAYLRTFLLAEKHYKCRKTLDEEALSFMYRALERDPYNSYVAALCAHVMSMMKRAFVAAHELAERSVQINRANAIGWACLGIAKCHLGKTAAGFKHTLFARAIAGPVPYLFQLDGLSCIAGSMAGEYEKAIWCGEASHAMAPSFAPPLRYLSALYLYQGRPDLSRSMIKKLQKIEPNFSISDLGERSYPSAGLQRSSKIMTLIKREL